LAIASVIIMLSRAWPGAAISSRMPRSRLAWSECHRALARELTGSFMGRLTKW